MTTDTLKTILKFKSLTFLLPSKDINYIADLHVTVYPKVNGYEHEVRVNGYHQRLLYGNPLEKIWFREKNNDSTWWREFREDWKYLLGLNVYPPGENPNTNFLVKYYVRSYNSYKRHSNGKREGHHCKRIFTVIVAPQKGDKPAITNYVHTPKPKQVPKPDRPKPNIPHKIQGKKDKLVCVKDLNTGEIERIPLSQAQVLIVNYSHYDYCKKEEWKLLHKIDFPKKDLYWKQNDEKDKDENGKEQESLKYPNNYLPKVKMETSKLGKIKIIGKKLSIVKDHFQKYQTPKRYDRHAKLQHITIYPKEDKNGNIHNEKFVTKWYIPRYVYLTDKEGKICKKIFVENIEKDVTFYRFPRITYKTIITKQYPPTYCERRRIIKKNMALLQQKEKEQKQQTNTQ